MLQTISLTTYTRLIRQLVILETLLAYPHESFYARVIQLIR